MIRVFNSKNHTIVIQNNVLEILSSFYSAEGVYSRFVFVFCTLTPISIYARVCESRSNTTYYYVVISVY